jgi:hypothetical protein
MGHTVARHTSAAFVGFLETVVETQPRRREMHIMVDNLSAHKTQQGRTFSWWRIRPSIATTRRPTRPGSINQALQQDRDVHPLGLCRPVTQNRMTTVQLVSTVR